MDHLPLDVTGQILDLLLTKEQLRLTLVCKQFQEACRLNTDLSKITIATTKERLDKAMLWMGYLNDQTYLTAHELSLTVKESFFGGEYDSNIGTRSHLTCNNNCKAVSNKKCLIRSMLLSSSTDSCLYTIVDHIQCSTGCTTSCAWCTLSSKFFETRGQICIVSDCAYDCMAVSLGRKCA